MNKELICGLDAAQIEELKAQHGALVLINVNFNEKTHQAIFKEPEFKDLEAIDKITKSNGLKGLRAAYDNCIVIADEEVMGRDILKIKAVSTLMERVQKTSAEAKNL